MNGPDPSWTLGVARDWLTSRLQKPGGASCPCCHQHAEVYRRTVTRSQVTTLRRLYYQALSRGQDFTTWVKLADIEQHSRDAATMQYWGLIREHGEKRGWWQLTGEGRDFLFGELAIEKVAHIYNNEVRGYSGRSVRVTDVDPEFDLDGIRGGPPPVQDELL